MVVNPHNDRKTRVAMMIKARSIMPLTKADIKDATLLLKAGNTDAARRIFQSSNDPRAIELLAQLDARFPPEPRPISRPNNDLVEVKRLIMQKDFEAAETLLRASNHPNAKLLLQRVAYMKTASKPTEKAKPRQRRSLWTHISVMLSGLLSSSN